MAKKKAAKKSKRSKSARSAVPRKKGPRSQTLPGMEQVRNARLDNLCEDFTERREKLNEMRDEDAGDMRVALGIMHASDIRLYNHGGTKLVRTEGEEKLSVRPSKDKATTDAKPTDEQVEAVDNRMDAEDAAAG